MEATHAFRQCLVVTNAANRDGWYPFEKLEVYQLAMRFRTTVKQIMGALRRANADDVDQLERSSKGTVRNICEGSGEYRPHEKARFYSMALRSAVESGGSLRMLEQDHGTNSQFEEAHSINQQLLAKLIVLSNNKGKSKRKS